MARTSNTDMLDTFRFQIQIDGMTRAGFSECSAPTIEIKVREYVEAGRHMNPIKITESATFPDIILKRGVSTDTDFVDWVQTIFTTNNFGTVNIPNATNRRTIRIFQYKRTGQIAKTYVLYNCIPASLQMASDFNAMTDAVSMESLKLAYEGFEVINADGRTVIRQSLDNALGSNGLF